MKSKFIKTCLLIVVFLNYAIPLNLFAFYNDQKVKVGFPNRITYDMQVRHWEGRLITHRGSEKVYASTVQNFYKTLEKNNPGWVLWSESEIRSFVYNIASTDGQSEQAGNLWKHVREMMDRGNLAEYKINGRTYYNGGDIFEHMGGEPVGYSVPQKWVKFRMSAPPEIDTFRLSSGGTTITEGSIASFDINYTVEGNDRLWTSYYVSINNREIDKGYESARRGYANIDTSVSIPKSYLSPGKYSAKLRVIDAYGREATKSFSYTVTSKSGGGGGNKPPVGDVGIRMTVKPSTIEYGDSFRVYFDKTIPSGAQEQHTTLTIFDPSGGSDKSYDVTKQDYIRISQSDYPRFFDDYPNTFDMEVVMETNYGEASDTGFISIDEQQIVIEVTADLDVYIPPEYRGLEYTQAEYDADMESEIEVILDAGNSYATNGVGEYHFELNGQDLGVSSSPIITTTVVVSPKNNLLNGSVTVIDSVSGDTDSATNSENAGFIIIGPPTGYIDAPAEIVQGKNFDVKGRGLADGKNNSITKMEWKVVPEGSMVGTLEGETSNVYFNEVGDYTIYLTVYDARNQQATIEHKIKVLPDIPVANIEWAGVNKENRKIELSLKNSIPSQSGKYELLNDKTEWEIIPLEGQRTEAIKFNVSPDNLTKTGLYKEVGEYKIRARIQNAAGNYSEWAELVMMISPDFEPLTDFLVDEVYVRDPSNQNKVTIQLKDSTYSFDDDIIVKRIWKYKYDDNNDGNFADHEWIIFNDGNNEEVTLVVEKLGNYLFDMEATEGFGQPTVEEFITEADYRKASTYTKKVEVVNVAPTTSLTPIVKPKVNVSLYGVFDKTTQLDAYKRTSKFFENAVISNGIDLISSMGGETEYYSVVNRDLSNTHWRTWRGVLVEGYYTAYQFDTTRGMVVLPSILQYNPNGYSYDTHRGFSVSFGWASDVSENEYTPNEPPPKVWYSSDGANWKETSSVQTYGYSDWRYIKDSGSFNEWPFAFRVFYYRTPIVYDDVRFIKVGAMYDGIPYQLKNIDFYAGRPVKELVKSKFDQNKFVIANNQLNTNTDDSKYIVLVTDLGNSITNYANISNNLATKGAKVIIVGKPTLQVSVQQIIDQFGGTFIPYDGLNIPWDKVEEYIVQDLFSKSGKFILLHDQVEYETSYEDYEGDPMIAEKWFYGHDPFYFENSNGLNPESGKDLPLPITKFDFKGRYDIEYLGLDDPTQGVSRFNNYRMWSTMQGGAYDLYVHERPLAEFEYKLIPNGTSFNVQVTDYSYDRDHESEIEKGIVEKVWKWKYEEDAEWKSGVLNNIGVGKIAYISLMVKDKEGAWSYPQIKKIDTKSFMPPIADFTVKPTTATVTMFLEYEDKSYDPNGFELIKSEWSYREVGKTTWVSVTGPPRKFPERNKTYEIRLRVQNIKGVWSNYCVRTLEIVNVPPVADFNMIPTVVWEGDQVKVTGAATDKDGDPLTYTYEITRVDGTGYVVATPDFTINTFGYTPGTWKIKLTVSDGYTTDSITKSFKVHPLTVTGHVMHTDQWNEHRIKYNQKKSGTDDSPRPYHYFFAGEKFILASDTTDTGNSETIADSVKVTLVSQDFTETLDSNDFVKWKGSMWIKGFDKLPDGDYTFEFTATWSNGVVKEDTVIVRIEDNIWKVLNIHRTK